MARRAACSLLVVAALCLGPAAGPFGALAQAQEPPPSTLPAPPPPAAWILVDVDTGAVLSEEDARTPRPPASTIKILTALIAVERLPADDLVPVSPLAEGMPARKINMKAGQLWDLEDTLHSLLLASANDAAVALAERVGGSLDGWTDIAGDTAERLGMEDDPELADPAGLDDEFSHRGGSSISARDLAIAARAALANPQLAAMFTLPRYEFVGGDALPHVVTNHNRFFDLYPGATGVKTGLTDRAGRCFVAAATRDGRTMLAVVLDAPDIYASAQQLLDLGFATPVRAERSLDRLPKVVVDAAAEPPPTTVPSAAAAVSAVAVHELSAADRGHDPAPWDRPVLGTAILLLGAAPLLVILRRRAMLGRTLSRELR